jgi:hypothetical protein
MEGSKMAANVSVPCTLTPAFQQALAPTVAHFAGRYARALQVSEEDLQQDAWLIILEHVLPKFDATKTKVQTFASRILARLLLRRARCMALPVKGRVGHEGQLDPKALRSKRDVHSTENGHARDVVRSTARLPAQLREEDFLEAMLPDLDRAVLEGRILDAAVRAEAMVTSRSKVNEDMMTRAVIDQILSDDVLREWAGR